MRQQRHFEQRFDPRGPSIFNNDFVGIASFNIFVGIAVATVFGAAFFFDLFWPERKEPIWVKTAWKVAACTVCVMTLADALALTVIVATREAYFENIDPAEGMRYLEGADPNPNLGESRPVDRK